MAWKLDDRGVLVTCASCGTRNRWPFTSMRQRIRCGQCKTEMPPLESPVEIGTGDQFRALTAEASLPVLVDFWAAWCGPCKMLAPELEKLASAAVGEVIVAKLNTEEIPDAAAAYRISSIPTLVLVEQGREVSRISGVRPASELLRFIRAARG